MSAAAAASEPEPATYEDLSAIELEFEDIESEIIAKQHILNKPVFHKREMAISRIPSYWALVFEQAPTEFDIFIQPSDSQVFAAALRSFHVDRPEIPKLAKVDAAGLEHFGQPRTVSFRFEFDGNEWFEDKVLEKTFYQRRSKDGFVGLISDPVRIAWKPGKDLSDGLTDAAFELWQAQKKAGNILEGPYEKEALKKRDAAARAMPEFAKLRDMMETSPEGVQSFFTWFSYRGPYISAAENEIAQKEFDEKRKAGEATSGDKDVEEEDEDEDLDEDEDDVDVEAEVEVFSAGEELALALSNDIWPSANKYFLAAQEVDVDGMEDDFEDDDDDDEDVEDVDMLEDIRNLVGKKHKVEGPPTKKQRR